MVEIVHWQTCKSKMLKFFQNGGSTIENRIALCNRMLEEAFLKPIWIVESKGESGYKWRA